MSFQPKLDILPAAQQALWPELARIPKTFVLYGGTALSLRLGHRLSVDFDFFTSEKFTPEQLVSELPFLQEGRILQSGAQTLTLLLTRRQGIKLSFFGGLTIGRVAEPDETEDGVLLVASLLDLAGLKAAVVTQRSESKDYLDLLALMDNGVSLATAMAAARALYPDTYNPLITAKALAYFEDGDLHKLTTDQRAQLADSAANLSDLPEIPRSSNLISPVSL